MTAHKLLLAIAFAAAMPVLHAAETKLQKPNILIILTDDQGYADLGCFGNAKNKTPRLDRLAEQGTRFTRID